ncbi:hypothetical protein BDV95DRAFT_579900, partial [Massariosphaeria phaeospora]
MLHSDNETPLQKNSFFDGMRPVLAISRRSLARWLCRHLRNGEEKWDLCIMVEREGD